MSLLQDRPELMARIRSNMNWGAPLLISAVAALYLYWLPFGTFGVESSAPKDREAALALIERVQAKALDAEVEALKEGLTPLEKKWGIKLLSLRTSAAGYVLDLRYKVLDSEKATPILYRKYNHDPHVIVERSGAKLAVPFMQKAGSLRSSVTTPEQIKRGRNYSMIFANPGRHAKPGDKVTLVFNDFKAKQVVTVQ